jgi:hypothetical protein
MTLMACLQGTLYQKLLNGIFMGLISMSLLCALVMHCNFVCNSFKNDLTCFFGWLSFSFPNTW